VRVFLDTNVLVAASIRQHPHFARANQILLRCVDGVDQGIINAHSLFEFHSAITQLPKLAVPPSAVESILTEGILPFVTCCHLTYIEILQTLRKAGQMGLMGGIIYDLYHLALAERENVEILYTFNTRHFQRIASPQFVSRIAAP